MATTPTSEPPSVPLGPSQLPPPPRPGKGWSAGRVFAVVCGSILGLIAIGILVGGGFAAWGEWSQRDSAGYLTSDRHQFSTTTYAISSEHIDLTGGAGSLTPSDLLGRIRVRATPATDPSTRIFVGIAPRALANAYLAGVSHDVVTDWWDGKTEAHAGNGRAPRAAPVATNIWAVRAAGPGTQAVTWKPVSGEWTVVVMNANGRPGVSVTADLGAKVPWLGWIAIGLLVGGFLLLVGATALIVVPVRRVSAEH